MAQLGPQLAVAHVGRRAEVLHEVLHLLVAQRAGQAVPGLAADVLAQLVHLGQAVGGAAVAVVGTDVVDAPAAEGVRLHGRHQGVLQRVAAHLQVAEHAGVELLERGDQVVAEGGRVAVARQVGLHVVDQHLPAPGRHDEGQVRVVVRAGRLRHLVDDQVQLVLRPVGRQRDGLSVAPLVARGDDVEGRLAALGLRPEGVVPGAVGLAVALVLGGEAHVGLGLIGGVQVEGGDAECAGVHVADLDAVLQARPVVMALEGAEVALVQARGVDQDAGVLRPGRHRLVEDEVGQLDRLPTVLHLPGGDVLDDARHALGGAGEDGVAAAGRSGACAIGRAG